ncbi:MAG TPA: NB-ARC domain-containing protein [Streptomyces sp.]
MPDPHTAPTAAVEGTTRFGAVLAGARAGAGLTQEELADRSGVSVRAIRNLETGRTARPRRQSAVLLVRALGLPPVTARQLVDAARWPEATGEGGGPKLPTVSELPSPAPSLVGREAVTGSLGDYLRVRDGHPVPGRLALVVGGPGSGKTATVTEVAHSLRHDYPDGQVFVDLDYQSRGPLGPVDVVQRVLRSFGTAQPPGGVEESSAQLRMLLNSRKVLVVLDNVDSEAQVRPLLSHSVHSAVLAAARRELCTLSPGLSEPLTMLTRDESCRLLEDLVGRARARAEPSAALSIAQSCGGLPLALRIAGLWLAARPHRRLRELADRLVNEESRLDVLGLGDLSVRSSIASSLRDLSEAERAALAGLSSLRGSFDLQDAVVRLGGTTATDMLEELLMRRLLEAEAVGRDGRLRYRLHDAVRLYAAQLVPGTPTRSLVPSHPSQGLTVS